MADFSEWSSDASATTASPPPPIEGRNIYIDPVNGNDNNDWETPATAARNCNTVFASDVIVPGVTVNFMAGTYNHLGVKLDSNYYLVVLKSGVSGTIDAPITLQAYPGHEGRVIFEGTDPATGDPYRQHGFLIKDGEYIHIKNIVFRKCKANGIKHYSARAAQHTPLYGVTNPQPGMGLPNPTNKGIIVDSCIFYDFSETNSGSAEWGPAGGNPAAVRIDSAENCEVRNCFVSKMFSEAQQNRYIGTVFLWFTGGYSKVTNCTTWYTQFVQFSKQHSCAPSGTEALENGVEVSYCYAEKISSGIPACLTTNNYCPPAVGWAHHNIIINYWDTEGCIAYTVTEDTTSFPGINRTAFNGRQYCSHNLAIPKLQAGVHVAKVVGVGIEFIGNITLNSDQWLMNNQPAYPHEGIYASDYNVTSKGNAYLRTGTDGQVYYPSDLAQWKTATTATHPHIKVDNPDQNSIEVGYNFKSFFTDFDNRDFTYSASAPWLGMMPDGSNPGPYQAGDEIIGCRIPWFDLRDAWPDIPDWLNPGKDTNR